MIGRRLERFAPAHDKSDSDKGHWLTGWRFIRDVRTVRLVVTLDVLMGVASAVWIAAIMLPFVVEELGAGERWWGYINAAYMLGSIAGSVLLLSFANRMNSQLPRWIVVGMLGAGGVTLCFGSSTHPLLALFFSFVLGPLYQMLLISKQTVLQQAAATDRLPYVMSAKGAIDSAVFGFSALAMGGIAEWLGTRTAYFLSAGFLCFAAVFAWRLRQPSAAPPLKVEQME
ncbi:MFS transporter [Brevibacillus sp. GCM10020057]|uniref:MFS transporter n=1 Tax=Brevibacillus sp. GCM10020057 TaxID=3317327 RepID=UPI00362A6D5F